MSDPRTRFHEAKSFDEAFQLAKEWLDEAKFIRLQDDARANLGRDNCTLLGLSIQRDPHNQGVARISGYQKTYHTQSSISGASLQISMSNADAIQFAYSILDALGVGR